MKIVYIIHSLGVGGAETIVSEYLLKLKEFGCDVFLIQFYSSNSFLEKNLRKKDVTIYTLIPSRTEKIFSKIKCFIDLNYTLKYKLKKYIKNVNPDIVHFHTAFKDIDFCTLNEYKTFFTFHTDVNRMFFYEKKFYKHLDKAVNKGISIVAITEKVKSDARGYFPNADIVKIYNGLDIREIQNNTMDKVKYMRKINIPSDAFVVGHVGRFHKVKNHEKVISVFEEIHKRLDNSYLILVGGGDQNRQYEIERLVKTKGLSDCVIFLGEQKEATKIMSIFDVFIFPSYMEGFPLVLIEAQAHNIRSIVSAAVPDDVLINDNCISLDIKEEDKMWAEYALSDYCIKGNRNINEVDIDNIIMQHINYYRRKL